MKKRLLLPIDHSEIWKILAAEENSCHDYVIQTATARGWGMAVVCRGEHLCNQASVDSLSQGKQVHTLVLYALVHDEINFNPEEWD